MFRVKRPAIIGLLVVLLVFTGYINHQLTQQALLKSSNEYQKHEELELVESENINKEDVAEKISEEESIELVDSEENIQEAIAGDKSELEQVIKTANDSIDGNITSEQNLQASNYFVEYRLSRDKLRANLIDRLDEIVNNSNTDEAMRTEAQKEIIKVGSMSQTELHIEGLIKGKGFKDALVFMTETDVKIVVSTNELSQQDMVKILDIVTTETKLDANNIKIMKKD